MEGPGPTQGNDQKLVVSTICGNGACVIKGPCKFKILYVGGRLGELEGASLTASGWPTLKTSFWKGFGGFKDDLVHKATSISHDFSVIPKR